MRLLLRFVKWIGIAFMIITLLIIVFLFWLSKQPFVPKDYTKTVKTGGELERKYLAMGSYETACMEIPAPEDWDQFLIYYPADFQNHDRTYPVVVFVNGTGVKASKYPALFEHLASWGFFVIGNEDPGTYSGDSADAALACLLEQNDHPESIFYQKVDTDHIGISGHSQGGVGVFNAINNQKHKDFYTCAVSLSPTEPALAEAIGMSYDPSKTSIPTMILAATKNDVITPDGLRKLYHSVNAPKAIALRSESNHGEMLYYGDGYVTAWFLYWLQDQKEAGTIFTDETSEFKKNPLYQQQITSLP